MDRAISPYHFRVKLGVEHRPTGEAIADSLRRATERVDDGSAHDLTAYLQRRDESGIRSLLARHYFPHNDALWQLLGLDWGWNDITR